MRVFINALTVRPGGGLTVIKGLFHSLRRALPSCEVFLLLGGQLAYASIHQDQDLIDFIYTPFKTSKSGYLFFLQNFVFAQKVKINSDDVLLSLNHYVFNVPCKQIIYHVNYRRFTDDFRGNKISELIQEYLRDFTSRKALISANANVFESRFLLESALDYYKMNNIHNSKVIYFGLMKEVSDFDLSPDSEYQSSTRLVSITSPNPHKDNKTLINILKELLLREPNKPWILDIVGGSDISQWNELRDYAKALNVAENIVWHGFCDQAKLTKIFHNALCLVSSSKLESFAMVAIEAMARECPPVVADCAAMPESIGNSGLLATPASATSFADCIQKISNSSDLRRELICHGNEWVKQFHWHRCGEEFACLMEQL